MADDDIFSPANLSSLGLMYTLQGMGGGQGGFDPSIMFDPRKRMQLQMAQNLMQQGTSTAPALTPLAGLARVGSAMFGGSMMSDLFPQQQQGTGQAAAGPDAIDLAAQKLLAPDDYNLYLAQTKGNPVQKLKWMDQLRTISHDRFTASMSEANKLALGIQAAAARGDMAAVAAQKEQLAALGQQNNLVYYQDPNNPGNVSVAPVPGWLPIEQAKAYATAAGTQQAQAEADTRDVTTWNGTNYETGPRTRAWVLQNINAIPRSWFNQGNLTWLQGGPGAGAGGGGGTAGSQGATGPAGPAGGAGTAAGGGPATGAAAPPAATGGAPASTTPTPPTQAPPPTSAEKNVAPIVAPTQGAGGVTFDPRIDAGIHAGERTAPGQVGAAGEVTSYQVTKGAAQAVGMALPKTEAEGSAVAQAYMAQNLRRFGNLPDAFAAYNWGPNAVANWINRGRDPAKMPASVQAYVQRAMGAYTGAAGGGAPATAPAAATATAPAPVLEPQAGRFPGEAIASAFISPGLDQRLHAAGGAIPVPAVSTAPPPPTQQQPTQQQPTQQPTQQPQQPQQPAQTVAQAGGIPGEAVPPARVQGPPIGSMTRPVDDPQNATKRSNDLTVSQTANAAAADSQKLRALVAEWRQLAKEVGATGPTAEKQLLAAEIEKQLHPEYSEDQIRKEIGVAPDLGAMLDKLSLQISSGAAGAATGGGHTTDATMADFHTIYPGIQSPQGTIDLFSNLQHMQGRRLEDNAATQPEWTKNREAESRGTGIYNGLNDPIETGPGGRNENYNTWYNRTHSADTYAKVGEVLVNPKNMPKDWNPWKQIPADQQNFAVNLLARELRDDPTATAWVPGSVAAEMTGQKVPPGQNPDAIVPVHL